MSRKRSFALLTSAYLGTVGAWFSWGCVSDNTIRKSSLESARGWRRSGRQSVALWARLTSSEDWSLRTSRSIRIIGRCSRSPRGSKGLNLRSLNNAVSSGWTRIRQAARLPSVTARFMCIPMGIAGSASTRPYCYKDPEDVCAGGQLIGTGRASVERSSPSSCSKRRLSGETRAERPLTMPGKPPHVTEVHDELGLVASIRASHGTKDVVQTTLKTDERVIARVTDGISGNPVRRFGSCFQCL